MLGRPAEGSFQVLWLDVRRLDSNCDWVALTMPHKYEDVRSWMRGRRTLRAWRGHKAYDNAPPNRLRQPLKR